MLAADLYHSEGRWSLEWQRILQQKTIVTIEPGSERGMDVLHSLKAERLWFRDRIELLGGLSAVYRFDGNPVDDALNLQALFQLRMGM